MDTWPLYVNGRFVETTGSPPLQVANPARGTVIAEVPTAGGALVQEAIDAAHAAFPAWAALPALQRGQLLHRAADALRQQADALARLLTTEQGKPLSEARGEIAISADYLDWNAEEARRAYGDTIPAPSAEKRLFAIRQPVGVVAAITPWNFPSSMITRKIGPALAAGCTVVVKPASATPLSAVALMRLFDAVGFPPGVVNLLVGSAEPIGQALLRDPRVRKISFTGSTEVGKTLMAGAAETMKKVSMELGGHAPFLVFDDANLDLAVDGIIASKFRNAGQTCICANRLYAARPIADELAERVADRVRRLVVGDGLAEGTDVGPLIDGPAMTKVAGQVADAVHRGGRLLVGGEPVRPPGLGDQFYAPTVILNPARDALIAREETFGPILPIWTFDGEDEAIALANAVPFGLAAYFYAENVHRVVRVAERLEYGIVGANDGVPTTVEAPFGGVKESGMGREGGHQGLDDYLNWKFISLGGF